MKESLKRAWPVLLLIVLSLGVIGASQIRKIENLVGITTTGQTTMVASLPVTVASDQSHVVVYSYKEKCVHDGDMYVAEYTLESLAVQDDIEMAWTTGTSRAPRVEVDVRVGGASRAWLWESPSISAGTAVTSYNKNRTSSNMATTVVSYSPSIAATGMYTLWNGRVIAAGSHKWGTVGGEMHSERIFDIDTDYLLRVRNVSSAAVSCTVIMRWCEPE